MDKRIVGFLVVVSFLFVGNHALLAGENLVPNGGFEEGADSPTGWGQGDLKGDGQVAWDSTVAHGGKKSLKISVKSNGQAVWQAWLGDTIPVTQGKSYKLKYYVKTADGYDGKAIVYFNVRGADNKWCAGVGPEIPAGDRDWTLVEKTIPAAANWAKIYVIYFAMPIEAGPAKGAVWIDDIEVMKSSDSGTATVGEKKNLVADPGFESGKNNPFRIVREKPLFKELLSDIPGRYKVHSWNHDINAERRKGVSLEEWKRDILTQFDEIGKAGIMGISLPWATDGALSWNTEENCQHYYEKYGMERYYYLGHFGLYRRAIANGAEIVDRKAYDAGRRIHVCWPIDPAFVSEAIKDIKREAEKYKNKPYLYAFFGEDEPDMIILAKAEEMSPWMKKIDQEVREKYGFGKYGTPLPEDPAYYTHKDTHPFQWIAFNRWMGSKYVETRKEMYQAVKSIAPDMKFIPCNFWTMEAFIPYDFSRMAECGDEIQCDPYPASGEKREGRGVYSTGFTTKLINDLTGMPTWCIIQAFDCANYSPQAEDIREWVSQAFKNGAMGIDYFESDCPRQNHPERYKEMLRVASIVTKMNKVTLPKDPDTAILFSSDSHCAEGPSCRGDEVYTTYCLLGERIGSWFDFISDNQLLGGTKKLSGYKIVYIPLAAYQRKSVVKIIEDYIQEGGTVVIGDPTAFNWDIDGEDLSKESERMLGIRLGEELKSEEIILTDPEGLLGLKKGKTFPLYSNYFPLDQRGLGHHSYGRSLKAYQVIALDKKTKVIAQFKTGEPAIMEREHGKGKLIYFAANPFVPDAVIEPAEWTEFFRAVQKRAGCKVDRSIWQFELPKGEK